MSKSRFFLLAALALLFRVATASPIVLYNPTLGNTPGAQGWLLAGGAGGAVTETAINGTTQLTTDDSAQAGYSSHIPLFNTPLNAGWPVLDADTGFRLEFQLQLLTEQHQRPERSGFSVILLDRMARGIELSFWEDEIWAKNDDAAFSHGEGAGFDSTVGLLDYRLTLQGDRYRLEAPGLSPLTGALRNYAGSGTPYDLGNYLFLGDDTTSAGASIRLGRVTLDPAPAPVPEPSPWLLWSSVLVALSGRKLKRRCLQRCREIPGVLP